MSIKFILIYSQIRELVSQEDNELEPLIKVIRKCRDEEDSHREIASQGNNVDGIVTNVSEQIIQKGCKGAIEIAKRI